MNIIMIIMMNINEFGLNSCMQRSESVCSSQIPIQSISLHDYCEDRIAPGTLGHIAQKTLHLAATNCTTGEHHNINFFSKPPTPQLLPKDSHLKSPIFLGQGNTSFAPAQNDHLPKRTPDLPIFPSIGAFGPAQNLETCC